MKKETKKEKSSKTNVLITVAIVILLVFSVAQALEINNIKSDLVDLMQAASASGNTVRIQQSAPSAAPVMVGGC